MEFRLNFNMDNAAFDDAPEKECADILRWIGTKVRQGKTSAAILDANGLKIGAWEITSNDRNS